MSLQLTCACGWETIGTEDEGVMAAIKHGRTLHNMEVTREQALAMAQPSND
jgi:predicted small metal-binding protein